MLFHLWDYGAHPYITSFAIYLVVCVVSFLKLVRIGLDYGKH